MFDGTITKFKLLRDRFLEVARPQQMVTMPMTHNRISKTPAILEQHQHANRFLHSAKLYSTTGGLQLPLTISTQKVKMAGKMAHTLQMEYQGLEMKRLQYSIKIKKYHWKFC